MASKDSDSDKKRILVVNRSDRESGSRMDSDTTEGRHGISKGDTKSRPDENSGSPKKSNDGETVVVLPKKATNLTPLSGPSIFNSDAETKNNAEKIVIKTPSGAEDGEEKQTIMVGNDKPEDIAPLGNVNGMFSNSNVSNNGSAAGRDSQDNSNSKEPMETTKNGGDSREKETVKNDGESEEKASTKGTTYSKISDAATAATGAITGATVAGAAAVGIRSNKNKPKREEADSTRSTNSESRAPAAANTTKGTDKTSNHVSIDEKRNVNHAITRSNNIPKRLENVPETSIINELRRNSSIVAEGFMYKKRPWLFCFWIQKYFMFLRTGELLFVELDGTGSGSGDWNIHHANALNKIDYEGYAHPHRLAFSSDASTGYFAFDNEEERDYWFGTFQDASR